MVEEGSLRSYIVRRTLLILPTLFGLVVLVFVISRLLPGDVAQRVLGPLASAQALANFRHQYGLDLPIPVQFYRYLVGLMSGDLGTSFRTSRPVLVDI